MRRLTWFLLLCFFACYVWLGVDRDFGQNPYVWDWTGVNHGLFALLRKLHNPVDDIIGVHAAAFCSNGDTGTTGSTGPPSSIRPTGPKGDPGLTWYWLDADGRIVAPQAWQQLGGVAVLASDITAGATSLPTTQSMVDRIFPGQDLIINCITGSCITGRSADSRFGNQEHLKVTAVSSSALTVTATANAYKAGSIAGTRQAIYVDNADHEWLLDRRAAKVTPFGTSPRYWTDASCVGPAYVDRYYGPRQVFRVATLDGYFVRPDNLLGQTIRFVSADYGWGRSVCVDDVVDDGNTGSSTPSRSCDASTS